MKNLGFGKFEYLKEESVKSGFLELDKIIQGWENGNLIVVAGHPSMGKTGFGVSLLRNIAIQNEIPVAFFSLEMSTIQFVHRLLSTVSGIESSRIIACKKGELTALSSGEQSKLNEAEKQIEIAPIFLDDTPFLSVQELCKKAMRIIRECQIKLIVVDYLQLMNSGMSFNNRTEGITLVIRSLKALAMELHIPIIVFSQLNRGVESREGIMGKRPQLSDLREFGAIEQDADMVCFIHRPEYYRIFQDEKGNDLRGMAEIIVAKNRNGKTGDARLRFLGEIGRFENIDE